MERPNILFILSDQHNARLLGHRGHPQIRTPHLDALAASGVGFDRAVAQNPICTPSRVSFLSGQYPHNHGYYGLAGPDVPALPSLFSHFREAGYYTGAIGKIHSPENWVERGCDVYHETCFMHLHEGGRHEYRDFLAQRGRVHLEDHTIMAEWGERGRQSMDSRPSALAFEESMEGWIAARINGAVDAAGRAGKPFLLHASLPRPHQCTTPSEPFWSMYEGVEPFLPPNADDPLTGRGPHLREMAARWRTGRWALFEPRDFESARRRKLRGYFGAISQVDHAVGLMLAHLEARGVRGKTIVVYSSDHGDYACEHGIMEKAPGICSDAVTRIPMIWSWPGCLPEGTRCRQWVEAIDVSATLCALAGVPEMETSDGSDLTPLLHGGGDPAEGWKDGALTGCLWSKAFCSGAHRLVYYPQAMFADEYPDGFGELYDLEADPWECHNRYFDPGWATVREAMERKLFNRLLTTTRPVTSHPPAAGPCEPSRQHRHYLAPDGKRPSPAREKPSGAALRYW